MNNIYAISKETNNVQPNDFRFEKSNDSISLQSNSSTTKEQMNLVKSIWNSPNANDLSREQEITQRIQIEADKDVRLSKQETLRYVIKMGARIAAIPFGYKFLPQLWEWASVLFMK
jgi:hypothetical protein